MSPQLGICFYKEEPKPIIFIHRFRVIEREKFDLLEPHERKKNFNFQINGDGKDEKIVVRIYLDENGIVYKSRYYFMVEMDDEMANYLTSELINRLKMRFKFSVDHVLKHVPVWK